MVGKYETGQRRSNTLGLPGTFGVQLPYLRDSRTYGLTETPCLLGVGGSWDGGSSERHSFFMRNNLAQGPYSLKGTMSSVAEDLIVSSRGTRFQYEIDDGESF